MVDELTEKFGDEDVAIAYIYFDYHDQEHQSAINVFASLLRQYAEVVGEITPALLNFFRTFCSRKRQPDLDDYADIIIAYSSRLSSLFLILDALDACKEDQRRPLLEALTKLFDAGIKVFATGRENIDELNAFFLSMPAIRIVADLSDIENYLTTRVNTKLARYGPLREKVVQTLSNQADGLYIPQIPGKY